MLIFTHYHRNRHFTLTPTQQGNKNRAGDQGTETVDSVLLFHRYQQEILARAHDTDDSNNNSGGRDSGRRKSSGSSSGSSGERRPSLARTTSMPAFALSNLAVLTDSLKSESSGGTNVSVALDNNDDDDVVEEGSSSGTSSGKLAKPNLQTLITNAKQRSAALEAHETMVSTRHQDAIVKDVSQKPPRRARSATSLFNFLRNKKSAEEDSSDCPSKHMSSLTRSGTITPRFMRRRQIGPAMTFQDAVMPCSPFSANHQLEQSSTGRPEGYEKPPFQSLEDLKRQFQTMNQRKRGPDGLYRYECADFTIWTTFLIMEDDENIVGSFFRPTLSTLHTLYPKYRSEMEMEMESILELNALNTLSQNVKRQMHVCQVTTMNEVVFKRELEMFPKRSYSLIASADDFKTVRRQTTIITGTLQEILEMKMERSSNCILHSLQPMIVASSKIHNRESTVDLTELELYESSDEESSSGDDNDDEHDQNLDNIGETNEDDDNDGPRSKVTGIKMRSTGKLHSLALHELIGRCIREADDQLMEATALTFMTFCTPEQLICELEHQMKRTLEEDDDDDDIDAEDVDHNESQTLQNIDVRIASMFKFLADCIFFSFYKIANDKSAVQRFCDIVRPLATNSACSDMFETLYASIEQKHEFETLREKSQHRLLTSIDQLIQKSDHFDFLRVSTLNLAIQLTLIEHDMYIMIRPHEFYDSAWLRQDKEQVCPNLVAVIRRYNMVANWVIATILQYQDARQRMQALCRFISVAWSCLSVRNFGGAFEVVSGLYSTPISRLKKTWELLDPKYHEKVEQLLELTSIGSNYRNYRKDLEETTLPALPNIAVHLRDLATIDDAQTSTVTANSGDEPLINMNKREMMAEIVKQLLRYQQTSYRFRPNDRIRNYLWWQLMKTADRDPKELNAEFLRISKELEPRDRRQKKR